MTRKKGRRANLGSGAATLVGVGAPLGFWGGTAVWIGVLGGNTADAVAVPLNVEIEKIEESRGGEKKETGASEGGNRPFEGNVKILAIPTAETRLSVCDLRPGDILAARWADEERNGTPGFWNHLAIVGADAARVVEAQKTADGIVLAPINDFLDRYSDVAVFRFFDAETARRAAELAEEQVAVEAILTPPLAPNQEGKKKTRKEGKEKRERSKFDGCEDWGNNERSGVWDEERTRLSGPRYSWSASLAPILRSDAATENCVSLVRRAFWKAAGVDYRWKTPDDLARWDKTGDFAKIGRL